MWIVRVALQRPYTFAVVALLILLASPVIILRTPTDIFPSIDIPVIAVACFLPPSPRLAPASAQVTAIPRPTLRQVPAGPPPPLIINYSASTVPILQLALSGMSESELNDVGLNFLRTQLELENRHRRRA